MARTERVVLICPDDLITKLDQYRRTQSDIPSRAEALRRLARAALVRLDQSIVSAP